jgi:Spy/CpxP family protein refolding chaperone
MKRSSLSTAVYLLLVFLSGIAVGVFANRLYVMNSVSANASSKSPEEWRRKYVEEMRSRLRLSDQQVAQLQPILDETRQRFHDAHERAKPELKAIQDEQVQKVRSILKDDQKAEFEKFRQEREKRRQLLDKKHP